jgi:hypothetical protein
MRTANAEVRQSGGEAGSSDGPRRIGELMPAVLARHGIRPERTGKVAGPTSVVVVQPASDVAAGMSEFLAMA